MRTLKVKKCDDTYRPKRCKKFPPIQHVPEMNITYRISNMLQNTNAIHLAVLQSVKTLNIEKSILFCLINHKQNVSFR